jgi:hypothetical protein
MFPKEFGEFVKDFFLPITQRYQKYKKASNLKDYKEVEEGYLTDQEFLKWASRDVNE